MTTTSFGDGRRWLLIAAVSSSLLVGAAACSAVPGRVVPSAFATPGASVQQYARAVGGPIDALTTSWRAYQDDGCGLAGAPATCAGIPRTIVAEAGALTATLTAAVTGGGPAYIGAPPPELQKLVAGTMAAAHTVAADVDATTGDVSAKWATDVLTLMVTLEQWDEYT